MASPASALHVARVKSLYMKALKLARSWNPDRGLFREQVRAGRARAFLCLFAGSAGGAEDEGAHLSASAR